MIYNLKSKFIRDKIMKVKNHQSGHLLTLIANKLPGNQQSGLQIVIEFDTYFNILDIKNYLDELNVKCEICSTKLGSSIKFFLPEINNTDFTQIRLFSDFLDDNLILQEGYICLIRTKLDQTFPGNMFGAYDVDVNKKFDGVELNYRTFEFLD